MTERLIVLGSIAAIAVLVLLVGLAIAFDKGCPKGQHDVVVGYIPYPITVGKVVIVEQSPILECQPSVP